MRIFTFHIQIPVVCERFTYSDIFESIHAQKKITKLISNFQRRRDESKQRVERTSLLEGTITLKKYVYTQQRHIEVFQVVVVGDAAAVRRRDVWVLGRRYMQSEKAKENGKFHLFRFSKGGKCYQK